jgi:hypothetical protein
MIQFLAHLLQSLGKVPKIEQHALGVGLTAQSHFGTITMPMYASARFGFNVSPQSVCGFKNEGFGKLMHDAAIVPAMPQLRRQYLHHAQ